MEDYNEYLLKRINKYFFDIAQENHDEILGDDSYRFFFMTVEFITGLLESIKAIEKDFQGMKFLDVGSGTGYICGIAEQMGLVAEGIELNHKLFEISTQMFPEIKFYEMNCMDFQNYGEYDIIYYWLPFRKPELMEKLKTKLEAELRVGGYLVLAEEEKQGMGKDNRFTGINNERFHNKIWRKLSN